MDDGRWTMDKSFKLLAHRLWSIVHRLSSIVHRPETATGHLSPRYSGGLSASHILSA
ncbi:MAG TPA: hypothetical protein VGB73_18645 [Pyrinomonadaceae bacterium]